MKIDPSTPVAVLCEQIREWSGYNGKDVAELLEEVADRLELFATENDDLRNQNHCNRVAAEARWNRLQLEAIRIKALEDAIEGAIGFLEMAGPVGATPDWAKLTATNLRRAKEAKP